MKLTGSFNEYFDAVHKQTMLLVEELQSDPQRKSELGQAIWNSLFELDGPKTTSKPSSEKSQFIYKKIFTPLSEIVSSLQAIENISIYANSFPYTTQGVSRVDYLAYHIENYLNEIYLLKNRLLKYATELERAYRKNENGEQIKDVLKLLRDYVESAFDSYSIVRGKHVHQKRFTDDNIDRLRSFELLTLKQDDERSKLLQNLYLHKYREVRKEWVKKMKADLDSIHTVLEEYFKTLNDIFTDDGDFLFPHSAKWT